MVWLLGTQIKNSPDRAIAKSRKAWRCGIMVGVKNNCSESIAAALRDDMTAGRYRAGERLPSVDDLRARFGAGEFAVRHALQRLRDEGFISLKQRMGAVTTRKCAIPWKGRVAFITVDSTASYFRQKLAIQLARRFRAAGWDFVPIFMDQAPEGKVDVESVRRYAANGLDFAVVMTGRTQIAEVCDDLSVPYIVLNGFTRDFPNARAVIQEDFRDCFAKLIRTLRVHRLKSVLEFDIERTMDRGFKNQLFEAGIAVRRVLCSWENNAVYDLRDIRRLGYDTVFRFFQDERNRAHLPDVILFDEDHLACGGILAMQECGLRIPKDVKVVTYSNCGNEPIAGISLARIENDPVAYGDAVAAYALKLLSGRRCVVTPCIPWRFVPGESL